MDSGFVASALGRGMSGTTLHRDALGYDPPRQPNGRARVTQSGDSLSQQFRPHYVDPRHPDRAARPQGPRCTPVSPLDFDDINAPMPPIKASTDAGVAVACPGSTPT
uniref:Uncharacterized protein n=1 Tax=Hyaloperonospora arabidopsidis (strain Emoy2) TaxID=559515 RepID=M4B1L5_HYAAE